MKFKQCRRWIFAVGVVLLASCETKNLPVTEEYSPKNELVELLWEAFNAEKSAAPERILPYFGITDVPSLKKIRPGYGWNSLSARDASGKMEQPRMAELGFHSIYYDSRLSEVNGLERKYMKIRLDEEKTCIAKKDVTAVFGGNYEKTPPAVIAPAPALPGVVARPLLSHEGDIAGMIYKSLFHENGSVWFVFEFHRCAESIIFNTKGKL